MATDNVGAVIARSACRKGTGRSTGLEDTFGFVGGFSRKKGPRVGELIPVVEEACMRSS